MIQGFRASRLVDGSINGEAFSIYIDKALVPTLLPGEIVVLDNLGSHNGTRED